MYTRRSNWTNSVGLNCIFEWVGVHVEGKSDCLPVSELCGIVLPQRRAVAPHRSPLINILKKNVFFLFCFSGVALSRRLISLWLPVTAWCGIWSQANVTGVAAHRQDGEPHVNSAVLFSVRANGTIRPLNSTIESDGRKKIACRRGH